MKKFLKKLFRMLCGDYSIYYIYSRSDQDMLPYIQSKTGFSVKPVDVSAIESSPDSLIREQIGYMGLNSNSYACYYGERIVGVCIYWFGDRYLKRNFWPLVDKEAKLVQIITLPEMRGLGVASLLANLSFWNMIEQGFSCVYARIWHSNVPSLRAFERAGWIRTALILDINPFRRKKPIRIKIRFKL
ncbi:MAG: GNAT family N-acetyltransferase [Methylococcaceae bacterium]